jgi:uracil-DNA glycosylase
MASESSSYDATPFVPGGGGLDALRRAARDCEGCPLYRDATGTVFGSGSESARVVLLGEQPGDSEDRQGEPFVGPAGKVLARALDEAGIDPEWAYVTNAVKHFKFEVRGKRRIHKPPSLREISACRPWLAAELRAVDPEVVVALGASAGKAVFGSGFRVSRRRGELLDMPPLEPDGGERGSRARGERGSPARDERTTGASDGGPVFVATIHPSAVLRADDREAAFRGLVSDLRVVADQLK